MALNLLFLKKIDAFLGAVLTRVLPKPRKIQSELQDIRRLLLIRPGGIGDAVLLVPAIHALRCAYPQAQIDVLAERRNASILQLSSEIDKVFCYDRPNEFSSVFLSTYDVVIDTEQWHRLSAIVARLIRAPIKIGYGTNERKRLFTHAVDYDHGRYEVESFFDLLSPLGLPLFEPLVTPFLQVPPACLADADQLLGALTDRPFVSLFPGASIAERRWGAEKFGRLAQRVNAEGLDVVVVGGPDDQVVGDAIMAGNRGLNLTGKTSLLVSAAVLQRSLLLISGDSGILHVGVGLGKPTVALFGPGIAEKWAPRGESHRVINKRLACSPCTRFGCTAPCPNNNQCMSEIIVEEVYAAVLDLLKTVLKEKAD